MQLIWFSEIKWNFLRTRKQQLLSRLPEYWEILFLETYRKGVENMWRPRRAGRVTYLTVPQLKNMPAGGLIRRLFGPSWVRKIFQILATLWIAIVIRRCGFGNANLFFISNVNSVDIARRLKKHRPLVYDCNDDHTAFPNTAEWTKHYFDKVCQLADQVIVSCESLGRKVREHGAQSVIRIDNGVDFQRFQVEPERAPDELAHIPTPRIGYIGAIDYWFHTDLWNRLTEHFHEASFVLIGPVNQAVEARLARRSNVHILGTKSYYDLPQYLYYFDLALIPFQRNLLTIHVNPNKLYEYFACGKTVVSTRFSDHLQEEKDHLYLADTTEQFIEQVAYALDHPVDPATLKKIASARSWDIASRKLIELIDHLAQKDPA